MERSIPLWNILYLYGTFYNSIEHSISLLTILEDCGTFKNTVEHSTADEAAAAKVAKVVLAHPSSVGPPK